jgi:hypothetical protein
MQALVARSISEGTGMIGDLCTINCSSDGESQCQCSSTSWLWEG